MHSSCSTRSPLAGIVQTGEAKSAIRNAPGFLPSKQPCDRDEKHDEKESEEVPPQQGAEVEGPAGQGPEAPDETVRGYFAPFTAFVRESLLQCGFPLNLKGRMASDPTWCQPLGIWKQYVFEWVATPRPATVANAPAFFDFRDREDVYFPDLSTSGDVPITPLYEYFPVGFKTLHRFLTERDRQVFAAGGFGALQGYGKRPAVVVVDVNYAFCGERPVA